MKHKFLYQMLLLFMISASSFSCSKNADEEPFLTVSSESVSFMPEGGTSEPISIEANSRWTITNSASSWLQLSKLSGVQGTEKTSFTASANNSGVSRSAVLTVTADNGQARRITVTQTGNLYPSYNLSPKPADAIGMGTAVELAAKFKLGWNIGNTFEAPGGETGWGSPVITEEYVKAVKQLGFSAIRIPCAWNFHLDNEATAHLDQNWIKRVKEVVGYCVNNDIYVMLNIHWDGGWLEKNITKAKQEAVNAKQKALWEQIATAMRDFDEHLMFASANEPDAKNDEEMAVLASYHQTFVQAVRSTGGRNSHRVLIVQGPQTNPGLTFDLMDTLPTDQVPNRLMVEVHNYTPSQFCIGNKDESWGKLIYYWGKGHHSAIEPERNATYGEEDEIIADYNKMKTKFVDKGIPVIMGEYGAYRRSDPAYLPKDLAMHNASVDYWINFTTKEALTRGIKPFWWDTGAAIDRSNFTVKDQRTIDAIKAGAN
ncbi:cellulase family glycosylhydrolase [Flavobacterium nitrogenifigens]|uniref:Aryl-phospho-beta-D-glucosidase BglC, GH1 family n=1 Tax=Flavobacterium nitrogenifigens TaxID=1617283 RepID=A0A521FD21_9FLAO|nr:cellulase family glycosylhydrolase [Flavobacterium nitrogenifigens]KAF2338668.1 cellulase family glycosylhydrolase [Flavobacterium nitrogenifigens]SMO93924.1 Aryl-phospho-beta-D-glucosidase BglC, GH1 family [Flavobacterium nitrogenifigens]